MGNFSDSQNLNTYVHPRLGPIKRLQNKNEQQYMEYEIRVSNSRKVYQWQQILNKMHSHHCNQFMLLPLEYSFEKEAICGSGGTITLKFEDYMFRLTDEIKNRRQIRRPFREGEIWHLIYILSNLGAILQTYQLKIGDVRPQNILINQEGDIKILSKYSWPGNYDNFQLLIQTAQEGVFISPQECLLYSQKGGNYPKGLDLPGCEVFSIGVTLLQVTSLQDCSKIYQKKGEVINQHKKNQYIDKINQIYSKELILIIQQMLMMSSEKRIRCSTISELLEPYSKKIKDQIPFQFDKTFYSRLQSARSKRNSTYISSSVNEFSSKISKFNSQTVAQENNRYSHSFHKSLSKDCHHNLENVRKIPSSHIFKSYNSFDPTPRVYPINFSNRNFYYYLPPQTIFPVSAPIILDPKIQRNSRDQQYNISSSIIFGQKNIH